MEDDEDYGQGEEDDFDMDDLAAMEVEMMRKETKEKQSLSSMFRKELETYLGDLDAKMDSEGNALVQVPSNFNDIVNAMTREDLVSDVKSKGKPSWFGTLMEGQMEADMNKAYGGRYRGLLSHNADETIQRGMAQIMLLDRQLQQLNLRSKQLDAGDDDHDDDGSAEGTPRSRTFITKVQGSQMPSSSQMPRSSRTTPRTPRQKKEAPPVSSPTKDEQLTASETARIEELLSMDDDDFAKVYSYIPDEMVQESKQIDQQLEQFDRMDRLAEEEVGDEGVKEQEDGKKAKARKASYLAQQRAERIDREREMTIDRLLDQYSRKMADYSSLIRPDPSDSRSKHCENLLDVPLFKDLRVNAPITKEDIQQLLLQMDAPSPSRRSDKEVLKLVEQYGQEIHHLEQLRAAIDLNRVLSAQSRPVTAESVPVHAWTAAEAAEEAEEQEQEVDHAFSSDDLLPLQALFQEKLALEIAKMKVAPAPAVPQSSPSPRGYLPRIDQSPRESFVLPVSRRVHAREREQHSGYEIEVVESSKGSRKKKMTI